MTASSTISAEELDRRFDGGEDLEEFFDMENPTVRMADADTPRRVNFSMPAWLIDELDADAKHLATSRQSIINMRLANYYENRRANATV